MHQTLPTNNIHRRIQEKAYHCFLWQYESGIQEVIKIFLSLLNREIHLTGKFVFRQKCINKVIYFVLDHFVQFPGLNMLQKYLFNLALDTFVYLEWISSFVTISIRGVWLQTPTHPTCFSLILRLYLCFNFKNFGKDLLASSGNTA